MVKQHFEVILQGKRRITADELSKVLLGQCALLSREGTTDAGVCEISGAASEDNRPRTVRLTEPDPAARAYRKQCDRIATLCDRLGEICEELVEYGDPGTETFAPLYRLLAREYRRLGEMVERSSGS